MVMTANTPTIALSLDAGFLERFQAHAQAIDLDLNSAIKAAMAAAMERQHNPAAASGPVTTQDQAAREALTKLRDRTTALENLTQQMTTHMRMLQEELDNLKRPAPNTQQQWMAEMLPTVTDDFAADF